MLQRKWLELMNAFELENNENEIKKIVKAYEEKHRNYHNLKHIKDCLEKCQLNEETRSNKELKLAIWYHDIVYNTFRKDNEEKSAQSATEFLGRQNVKQYSIIRVRNLIMATLHNKIPNNEEEAYMMDIDISILGSHTESYVQYTEKIRAEYYLVPWFLYKKKRIEILEKFLAKKNLYFTEYFKSRLELAARKNIENEIVKLKSKT